MVYIYIKINLNINLRCIFVHMLVYNKQKYTVS